MPQIANLERDMVKTKKIPQCQGSEGLSKTICPSCRSKAKPFLSAQDINRQITPEVFTYSQCSNCGLVFIDEIPDDMTPYYSGGYQTIPTSLEELRELARPEKYRLEPIMRHKRSGKLLELGPWIGLFASNAKDAGFDVTAIDINKDCVSFLKDVLDIKAIQSDDPALTLANLDDRFDIVVLWHCLEHFPRPWEVIQQISRVLQPGGILLVAIPNIQSYEFGVLKSRWVHIDAPRHLYFYPLDSLTSLCKQNGLSCVEATTVDQLSQLLRRSSWRAWGNRLVSWPFMGRVLSAILGRLDWLIVGSAGRREGAGAGITAIYKKEAPAVQANK